MRAAKNNSVAIFCEYIYQGFKSIFLPFLLSRCPNNCRKPPGKHKRNGGNANEKRVQNAWGVAKKGKIHTGGNRRGYGRFGGVFLSMMGLSRGRVGKKPGGWGHRGTSDIPPPGEVSHNSRTVWHGFPDNLPWGGVWLWYGLEANGSEEGRRVVVRVTTRKTHKTTSGTPSVNVPPGGGTRLGIGAFGIQSFIQPL